MTVLGSNRGHRHLRSSFEYFTKSAFSTRMRMVARKPVSSSTVTHELMMENQWICGGRYAVAHGTSLSYPTTAVDAQGALSCAKVPSCSHDQCTAIVLAASSNHFTALCDRGESEGGPTSRCTGSRGNFS